MPLFLEGVPMPRCWILQACCNKRKLDGTWYRLYSTPHLGHAFLLCAAGNNAVQWKKTRAHMLGDSLQTGRIIVRAAEGRARMVQLRGAANATCIGNGWHAGPPLRTLIGKDGQPLVIEPSGWAPTP